MSTSLSLNGIAKLKQNTASLLQIIELDLIEAKKPQSKIYIPRVALSDGFAYAKWYLLPDQVIRQSGCTKDQILYQLITVKKTENKNSFVVITSATIQKRGLKGPIGQPLTYEEFVANDGNPKGSNIIPGTIKSDVTPGGNSQKSVSVREEFKTSDSNTGTMQSTSKPEMKPVATKQTTLSTVPVSNPKLEQPKVTTKAQPQKRSASNPPIQKVEPKKREPIQNDHMFTPLTDLFAGQEGWTIKVRVSLKSELKKIKTKKGDDTYVLNLEFIDRQGTVMGASCFGDTAQKFANALQLDFVYEVSNAQVLQDAKSKGQMPFKINLGEKAIVNEANDDGTIPTLKDRTTTLAEYIDKPINSQCNIICLVKSAGQAQRFTSKAGKPCIKRPVLICDPQDKIELNIFLWGQAAASFEFQNHPYYISNMKVSEFQGTKQYSSGFTCMIVPLKEHSWRRFKDVSKIEFKKVNESSAPNKKGNRLTIADMLDKAAVLEPNGRLWSEMKCFVNTIRTTGTIWYLSCPNNQCKKKVVLETKSQCAACLKHYQNGVYRWILNVEFVDFTGSAWASVYGQQAQAIVGKTADELHTLDIEAIKEIVKERRNTQYVILFRSMEERHEEQTRVKHVVCKLHPVNPIEEANICIKQINQYLNI